MKLFKGISSIRWIEEWQALLRHLPDIQDSIARGTTSTLNGVSNSALALYGRFFISKSDIEELSEDIEDQGGRYRELLNGVLIKKDRIKDSFALGGDLYTFDSLPKIFPSDIENAFAEQYPNLAAESSLSDHLGSLNLEQQHGLISGIKGKLFEQKYVDYLNNGELPEGLSAKLADNPTQEGWDIVVQDSTGQVDQLLQAKATDSVGYVKEALQQHPHIDVVTTDEVYSQLVMQGVSDGLINSGISNESIVSYITEATGVIDTGLNLTDFAPPVITWALIAFTSYKDPTLKTVAEKFDNGGTRLGKAYFAYLLGVGVTALTNTWWLGLAATVTSRATADEGYRKYELMRELRKAKRANRGIIRRWTGEARAVSPA